MDVRARAAQLAAQDVIFGDSLKLQELRITAAGLRVRAGSQPGFSADAFDATLILTEASLNQILAANPPEGTRDLQIATLSGRIRIDGTYFWNRIPVPFALTGVPEIEGGARLRIGVQQVRVLGPISLPQWVSQGIGNRINDKLGERVDATKLPIPVRLTGLTVEPGRILLSATAAIDIIPSAAPPEALQKLTDEE